VPWSVEIRWNQGCHWKPCNNKTWKRHETGSGWEDFCCLIELGHGNLNTKSVNQTSNMWCILCCELTWNIFTLASYNKDISLQEMYHIIDYNLT
jgi:hypothetical protein